MKTPPTPTLISWTLRIRPANFRHTDLTVATSVRTGITTHRRRCERAFPGIWFRLGGGGAGGPRPVTVCKLFPSECAYSLPDGAFCIPAEHREAILIANTWTWVFPKA